MIELSENVDLKPFNTFGLSISARHFIILRNVADLKALLQLEVFRKSQKLVLGGGSNVLFTKNFFDGLVIKNEITGIEITRENDDATWLTVGAGETWHSFVMHCIENNLGGIENLSLIPGSVGAAPMQNIGAYGAEVKDVIESVTAFDFNAGALVTINHQDCRFGYRESMFKHEGKERYLITHVTFRLTKRNHRYNTSYGAIQENLSKMNIKELSLRAISDAVIAIRRSKLPDPTVIGNAGSFFKNPTISIDQYKSAIAVHPQMPSYPVDSTTVKVPAGWLIEQCGWKGKTIGKIGVHVHQALVLVNYGGGTGQEIFRLAQSIQQGVRDKFGFELHMEVNIL